jgi:hypothetical protein
MTQVNLIQQKRDSTRTNISLYRRCPWCLFKRVEDGIRKGEIHGDVADEQDALLLGADVAATALLIVPPILSLTARLCFAPLVAAAAAAAAGPVATALIAVAAAKSHVSPVATTAAAADAHAVAVIAAAEGTAGTTVTAAKVITAAGTAAQNPTAHAAAAHAADAHAAATHAAATHAAAARAVGLELHYSFLELLDLLHEHFGVWCLTPGLMVTPAPRLTGRTWTENRGGTHSPVDF